MGKFVRFVGLGLSTALAATTMTLATSAPTQAGIVGAQGCSPGYWKNHTDNWWETPTERIPADFTLEDAQFGPQEHPYTDTLLQALKYKGGPGLKGAEAILLRAAAAAWLNAADDRFGYPYRRWTQPMGIIATVNDAMYSHNRQVMLDLAKQLDDANNLGCPL